MRQSVETLQIGTRGPGLYEFTGDLGQFVTQSGIATGLVTAFCRHTSASLLIQENADRDVQTDLDAFFRRLAPEGMDWIVHRTEGPDDMPAHIKSALTQTSIGIPVVHGSIFRFEGMVSVFDPKHGPTYRDMVPEPPPAELAPSCAEAGVLGVLPGIIGSIQALEAIKVILDLGDSLSGRLLAYDAMEQSFRTFKVRRDPQCPACSLDPEQIVIAEYDDLCMPHPVQAPASA